MSSAKNELSLSTKKLKPHELSLGMELPWSIYDADHALLLHQGAKIDTERQLALLLENAFYRVMTTHEVEEEKTEAGRFKRKPPFVAIREIEARLAPLLRSMVDGSGAENGGKILALASDIGSICDHEADGILAAVHLAPPTTYTVQHPIHAAVLCALLAQRMKLEASRRISLIAAALTMNIGMLDLQNQLFEQREELSPEQKKVVLGHPEASVKALYAAGVTDHCWLLAIHQHHERVDGSGYPKHLAGGAIALEAKMLALADMYAALVTPRKHRKPVLAKEALRSIFMNRGKEVDEELAGHFIREIGIFPPGVFVRLVNGEIAVVARRAIVSVHRDSTAPVTYAVINSRGGLNEEPQHRDCNIERFHIEAMCLPDIDHMAVLQAIWGQ